MPDTSEKKKTKIVAKASFVLKWLKQHASHKSVDWVKSFLKEITFVKQKKIKNETTRINCTFSLGLKSLQDDIKDDHGTDLDKQSTDSETVSELGNQLQIEQESIANQEDPEIEMNEDEYGFEDEEANDEGNNGDIYDGQFENNDEINELEIDEDSGENDEDKDLTADGEIEVENDEQVQPSLDDVIDETIDENTENVSVSEKNEQFEDDKMTKQKWKTSHEEYCLLDKILDILLAKHDKHIHHQNCCNFKVSI
jgi:hypothetical protein